MPYESVRQLPEEIRRVHRLFTKPELIDIADELDLEVEGFNSRQIVLDIINDLDARGIPDTEECSDELFEFLLNINYISDTGEILEISKKTTEPVQYSEEIVEETPEVEKPECFSFAEIRDPACKRCILFDACSVARKKARPACFGLRYEARSEECRLCIESTACRTSMK